MEPTKELTLDQLGIRHLGIFRRITKDEAWLDKTLLRGLYRSGYYEGLTEGQLANCVPTVTKDDPAFQASIARLVEWQMVECTRSKQATARRVTMLPTGKYWAEELVAAHQLKG